MTTGTKKNGGRRPGAGRKTKAEEAGVIALLADAWTEKDRKAVILALVRQAKKGNVQASTLLMSYAYGKPPQPIEHGNKDGKALKVIVEYVGSDSENADS